MDFTAHALLREIRDLLRAGSSPADSFEQRVLNEVDRLKFEARIEGNRSAIAAHWAEKGLRRGIELAKDTQP